MRPACRAGDASLRRPCSECVHVALLGLMLTHLLIWSQWQQLPLGVAMRVAWKGAQQ